MSNRLLLALLSMITSVALVACGGGGGGSSSSSSTTTPAPANTNVLNITAATGAPLVGATVTIVDANGVTQICDGVTADNGTLACNLPKSMIAPFYIKAQSNSITMFGVLPTTSAAVNVTPVSDLMAKQFAAVNNLSPENIIGTPSNMAKTTKDSAQAAVDVVTVFVKAVALKTGSAAIVNDPLTGIYDPLSVKDPLDQFVKNYPVSTDGKNINVVVPTATGATNISILGSTSASDASSAANAAIASSGTPVAILTDADDIDALMSKFATYMENCTPDDQARLVALIDGTYANGRTIADFVKLDLCSGSLKGKNLFTKDTFLTRIGQTVIYPFVITKLSSGQKTTVDFGFRKVNGSWKWAADNLPFSANFNPRQSLNLQVRPYSNSTGAFDPQLTIQRYVDAWIGGQDAYIPSALPDKVQVYVIREMDANTILGSAASFNKLTPDFTMYKRSDLVIPNNGCQSLYTLKSDRLSCDNSLQEQDNGYNSFNPTLFSQKLDIYPLSFFVYKLVDASGACLNCVNGIPNAGQIQGRTRSISEMVPSIVDSLAVKGASVGVSTLSELAKNQIRTYFAIPSDNDLKTLATQLQGTNMTDKITVPWVRSTSASAYQIDLWDSTNTCGTLNTNLGDSVGTFDVGNANSHTFTYGQYRLSSDNAIHTSNPEYGKTFNNAAYFSVSLSTAYKNIEYVTYLYADRYGICTP